MRKRQTANRPEMRLRQVALLSAATLAIGCGQGDTDGETSAEEEGTVEVLLEAEDTITGGLEAGNGGEDIRDGWAVSFEHFVATVGDIDLHFATDESIEAEAEDVFVVDLTKVPESGLSLWKLEGLCEGRWEFNYGTPGAAHGGSRHSSVEQSLYEEMVDKDWTYFIDAVMTKSDGQSCPPAALATPGDAEPNGELSGDNDCYDAPTVRLSFGVAAETSFGPCVIDDVPGVAVTAGRTRTVAATIHGDHLFFNGFPEGDEGGITRLAQWLADCDLNLDGTVTQDELEAIKPAQLPELDPDRYQLGGAPIEPTTMYEYARAQLKTQGHFQGEGECPVDGAAHEHEE